MVSSVTCVIVSLALFWEDVSKVSGADWKEEDEVSSNSPKQIMHLTNISEHIKIIFKWMLYAHVFVNLVSLSKNSNPHWFLDLINLCVFQEFNTTRI